MMTPMQLVAKARESINENDASQLCQAIDDKMLIIDVREPGEFSQGSIACAINVPRGLLEFAIFDHPEIKPKLNPENPAATPVYLYCKSGGRSALAAKSLQDLGFTNVYSLGGGIDGWQNAGFKVSQEYNYQY